MVFGTMYGAARTAVSEGAFNPDYATPTAALDMVTEGLEIDQKFFNLFVEHDFLEAAAMGDVALESTLMAVDESFLGDVWSKIRDFIKKIRDKIVSIFKAAAVKIGAFFTKDNESLVSRYDRQYKAASTDSSIIIKGFRKMEKDPSILVTGFTPDKDFKDVGIGSMWNGDDPKNEIKRLETIKKNTTVSKMLKACHANIGSASSGVDSSSAKIDYLKALFANPKDMKATELGFIGETLKNHQNAIKQINDAKDALDDILKTMDEDAKKQEDINVPSGEGDQVEKNNNTRQVETKKAEVARTICTVTNSCVGKLSSAALDAIKFNIKQCRAAYIKIATKGAPSVKKESADLLEAMIEADAYEVDSFFDQYSYDYDELTA